MPFAINASGQIVGYWEETLPNTIAHGFTFDGTVFTSIEIQRINSAAQMVGVMNPGSHAFLRNGDMCTPVDFPGASSSDAWGINDASQIVGIASFSGVPCAVAVVVERARVKQCQRRRVARGRCRGCELPLAPGSRSRCWECLERHRISMRKRRGTRTVAPADQGQPMLGTYTDRHEAYLSEQRRRKLSAERKADRPTPKPPWPTW